jgi:hypothetical protein
MREGSNQSRGISDLLVQLEYTYLNRHTATSALQGTFVSSLFLPTGSTKKSPKTGFGSPGFFLGTTLAYTKHWWGGWIQAGALLTTMHNRTKYGGTFLYQAGLEKCFFARSGWILAFILDAFGLYEQKDTICGCIDPNSGGNSIWIGPSLWASSKRWILQFGVATPLVQKLNGIQNRSNYYVNLNVGYKF